jgi:hypothetical protein
VVEDISTTDIISCRISEVFVRSSRRPEIQCHAAHYYCCTESEQSNKNCCCCPHREPDSDGRRPMSIVHLPWTRYGTDDILVRHRRKGCPEHLPDILIPMGAWCSNASTEPGEYTAKATGGMRPIRQNEFGGWGNFVKKKVAGRRGVH